MPTFSGDISIVYMKRRDDDGTINASSFANVQPDKDHLIGGTTTLFNSQIAVKIYESGNVILELRVVMADMEPLLTDPPPTTPTPAGTTNTETALVDDTITTGESSGPDVGWSILVNKNTFTNGKSYTIIASDSEDLASASESFTTAP